MKRILIVSKYFYPEITPRAFRAFELAKEFSRMGHDVRVLTDKKKTDFKKIETKYKIRIDDIIQPVKEPRKETNLINKLFRFVLKYFFQYPESLLVRRFKTVLLEQHENYDLLISIAYPYQVHFGVALAMRENSNLTKTWIADCGDPFIKSEMARLPYPFYYHFIENWFCKQPDFITVPMREAKSAYPKGCQKKLVVIPQGFDFGEVRHRKKKNNSVPTFAYAGNLSSGLRDPRPLLDYLIERGKDFKFVIYTKNRGFLTAYEKKLEGKLEFRDFVPRKVLLEELSEMDFLLNIENKTMGQKPSKIIDYALLKKPILSIRMDNVNTKVVLEFLNKDYRNGLVVKDLESYNIKSVANKFINLTYWDGSDA